MYIDLAEVMRLKGRLVDINSEIDGTLKNVNNELDTVCSTINSDNLIQANNSIKEKVLSLSTNLVNNLNKLTEFMGTQLENYTVSYQEAESALQSLVNHLNTQYRANGVISYDTTSVVESASPTAIVGAVGIAGLGAVSAGAMYSPNYVTTDYSIGGNGNYNVGVSSQSNGMGSYTTYFPNSSTPINGIISNSSNAEHITATPTSFLHNSDMKDTKNSTNSNDATALVATANNETVASQASLTKSSTTNSNTTDISGYYNSPNKGFSNGTFELTTGNKTYGNELDKDSTFYNNLINCLCNESGGKNATDKKNDMLGVMSEMCNRADKNGTTLWKEFSRGTAGYGNYYKGKYNPATTTEGNIALAKEVINSCVYGGLRNHTFDSHKGTGWANKVLKYGYGANQIVPNGNYFHNYKKN